MNAPSSFEETNADVAKVRIGLCKIPPEVLSEILEIGKSCEENAMLDHSNEQDKPFELVVAQICLHVRQVALATPKLWSTIRATTKSSPEYVKEYLARSSSSWLDIRLDLSEDSIRTQADHGEVRQDALVDIVITHSSRWRTLAISGRQRIIERLCSRAAAGLQQLSITVDDVEEGDSHAIGGEIWFAPRLEVIRLRGFGLHLFRPQMGSVVTLHLDETKNVPLPYARLYEILTSSPSLTALSIFGDIISPESWPQEEDIIPLPALQSLRICGVSGNVYSGVLIAVHAPKLESLTLKDLHEHDLDSLLGRTNTSKFRSLKRLVFCDFEVSLYTYQQIMLAFQNITTFSTLRSSISESPLVDVLLEPQTKDGKEIMWPMLEALSFPLTSEVVDEEVAQKVVSVRAREGYPVSRMLFTVSAGEEYETPIEVGVQGISSVMAISAVEDQDDILFP